jgi:hypothetical protein
MAIAQGTQSAGLAKINVFLGPKPKEGGFVVTNKVFQDSYRDMEEAYRKDTDNAFRPFINLVGSADQAEVIVEITSRNSPMLAENRALLATLFVVGSDFKVDLDGRTGVRHIYWNKQALNLLSQTVEWIKANRAVLDKQSRSRTIKPAP